tara:strand:+ start:3624 stop:4556 length:933 start_codon:yes stop_codon:yes gene_type:complete
MSIYSRDYMKEGGPNRGGMAGPGSWGVITWILAINIAVFVISLFVDTTESSPIKDNLGLSIGSLTSFRIWTLLTYQFVHQSPLHLIVNMIGVFFIGRMLLGMVGKPHFLRIYFIGGIAGGIAQILFNLLVSSGALIIGASGCFTALILALATLIPHQSLNFLLFFIIPVKMTLRQIVYLMIAIEAITLIMGFTGPSEGTQVAVMAHVGGMLLGWAYIKYWFPRSGKPKVGSRRRRKSLKEKFGIHVIKDTKVTDLDSDAGPDKKAPFVTADVDAILDKINERGFQSLTEEEKKVLKKSSNRLSKRLDKDS